MVCACMFKMLLKVLRAMFCVFCMCCNTNRLAFVTCLNHETVLVYALCYNHKTADVKCATLYACTRSLAQVGSSANHACMHGPIHVGLTLLYITIKL